MHIAEKKKIIESIERLGRRVTAADIAADTGLPLLSVQQGLNHVASEANGHLQVATTGDIAYQFDRGFSNVYLARGLKSFLRLSFGRLYQSALYLLRISFGVSLIVCFTLEVIILVAVLKVMQLLMYSPGKKKIQFEHEGPKDPNGLFGFGGTLGLGSGFRFNTFDLVALRQLLSWETVTIHDELSYHYGTPTVRTRNHSNFLLNCYSFLFGDGDPNEGLDEKRWLLIAHVIKKNNNVLTSEQLAPYTGADPGDEDAVLPILVRFNGRPEVTEKGNIVYVFESLQSTASDQHHQAPTYLQEFPFSFTTVPGEKMISVYLVAGLNLFFGWALVLFFSHPFSHIAARTIAGETFFLLINSLCIYANLFLTIPAIRAIILNARNQKIEQRNIVRAKYSLLVSNPSPMLSEKLKESAAYKIREKLISDADIIYTTEKDVLDQHDELDQKFQSLEAQQDFHPDEEFDASP